MAERVRTLRKLLAFSVTVFNFKSFSELMPQPQAVLDANNVLCLTVLLEAVLLSVSAVNSVFKFPRHLILLCLGKEKSGLIDFVALLLSKNVV